MDTDGLQSRTDCGVGIRGVAMFIDSFVWLFFFMLAILIVGVLTGETQTTATGVDTTLNGFPALVSTVLWLSLSIGYHTILEWQYGQTAGKYLIAISVTGDDGSPLSLREAVIRNVARLIDHFPVFYLVGVVLIVRSEHNQRLGDRLADSRVVR